MTHGNGTSDWVSMGSSGSRTGSHAYGPGLVEEERLAAAAHWSSEGVQLVMEAPEMRDTWKREIVQRAWHAGSIWSLTWRKLRPHDPQDHLQVQWLTRRTHRTEKHCYTHCYSERKC